jgi:hypothetical protein
MAPSDLLRYFTTVLEQLGLRYFVTGSVATIFFGEPRFTNDIDIVVDLAEPQISRFCLAFPSADFYVSRRQIRREGCTTNELKSRGGHRARIRSSTWACWVAFSASSRRNESV